MPADLKLGSAAPLPASALRKTCNASQLGFKSTAELEPVDDLIGQERALTSLAFGANIRHDGFNVFALGPAGSGRHGAIRRLLERQAGAEAVPDDWVYVNNFAAPNKPKAIRLPPGTGPRLKVAMAELVDDHTLILEQVFSGFNGLAVWIGPHVQFHRPSPHQNRSARHSAASPFREDRSLRL